MKSEEFNHLTKLLQVECRNFKEQSAVGKSPLKLEQQQIQYRIHELTDQILGLYEQMISVEIRADALIKLMDAYEIYPDENQLQVILSLSEKLLPALPDSPLKCKLLTYCYFYVEEPGCACEAKRILDSWDKCNYSTEMTEAETCYFNLVDFA